jgi:6-phosphogluconolactonase
MREVKFRTFDSRESLDTVLAENAARAVAAGIDERGEATLAVSGGSTPRGVLEKLGARELPWNRVRVTLVDDRWVPTDHADSNERMVRERLLSGPAGAASFVSLHTEAEHPRDGLAVIEDRLGGFATFDYLMLGMGPDGHFASLFPGADNLAEGLALDGAASCIAVDPPVAPHARISMTLPRIADTRRLVLHLTGDDKRAVFEQAVGERDAQTLPIAAVIELPAPQLEVLWAP